MFAGLFYWIGALALLCLSIFPYVGGLDGFSETNNELWILTFIDPIMALLNAKAVTSDVLMPAVVSILYVACVVVSFICVMVSTSRLFRITKRNPTNKWGYNRATRAMRVMGKCFALMFFMTFAIALIGVTVLDGKLTLFFYIAFAVALLFHLVVNFRACKVSLFETVEDRFNPIEKKPNVARGVSVIRNVWQMASIWLVFLLIDKLGNCAPFFQIIDGGELAIVPALLVGTLVFLLLAVANATSIAGYKVLKKKKNKLCAFCALMIAILGLVGVVLTVITPELDQSGLTYFIVLAVAGAQWFIAERIFASIIAKRMILSQGPYDEEKSKKEIKAEKKAEKKAKKDAKKAAKQAKKEAKKEKKANKKAGNKAKAVAEEVLEPVEGTVFEPVEESEEDVLGFMENEEVSFGNEYVRYEPTYFVADFLETPDFEALEKKANEDNAKALDYDENAAVLRDKWLTMSDFGGEEVPAPDTKMLTAQQVRCPSCNTVLYVRFGWTKATCSNCGKRFEMRRCSSAYNYLKNE